MCPYAPFREDVEEIGGIAPNLHWLEVSDQHNAFVDFPIGDLRLHTSFRLGSRTYLHRPQPVDAFGTLRRNDPEQRPVSLVSNSGNFIIGMLCLVLSVVLTKSIVC